VTSITLDLKEKIKKHGVTENNNFFTFVFLCFKEHFSIFVVQYLGVTAGIELAT
jgi:hypothetical protein